MCACVYSNSSSNIELAPKKAKIQQLSMWTGDLQSCQWKIYVMYPRLMHTHINQFFVCLRRANNARNLAKKLNKSLFLFSLASNGFTNMTIKWELSTINIEIVGLQCVLITFYFILNWVFFMFEYSAAKCEWNAKFDIYHHPTKLPVFCGLRTVKNHTGQLKETRDDGVFGKSIK
jgi:hypothetical protein